MRGTWQLFAAWMLAYASLAGCKSSGETCRRQIAECLRRCDTRGADTAPPTGAPHEQTLSLCEANCQHCAPEAPPKPTPKPTPTGDSH